MVLSELGDGSFGTVSLAVCNHTGEKVAIKKMKKKYATWNECLALREVKSLQKLVHPQIIKLRELVRENDWLHFVFEYLPDNLYQVMQTRKIRMRQFSESEIKWILQQVLFGLGYMHKNGYFHRDIKPENILIDPITLNLKIADLGLAREIRARPPYTEYISTRWYRAPEVLMRLPYSAPIDMWAVACMVVELYTLTPLFPGSSEIDQMYKISAIIGPPPSNLKIVANRVPLNVPNASPQAMKFITSCLIYEAPKRPSPFKALEYELFLKKQVEEKKPKPKPKAEIDALIQDFENMGEKEMSFTARARMRLCAFWNKK